MLTLSANSFSAFIMQSAYYLHINQAVDHERTASQPNAALSQEKHSVIIIHQCYDVVIDYNIFLLPLGSPSANPAPGTLDRLFFLPQIRETTAVLRVLFLWSIDPLSQFREVFKPCGTKLRVTQEREGLAGGRCVPLDSGVSSLLRPSVLEVLLWFLRKFPYLMKCYNFSLSS